MKLVIHVLIILVVSCCAVFKKKDTPPVIYKIQGNFKAIKQPKSMACWATVGCMLDCWKNDTLLTVEQFLNQKGGYWKGVYKGNKGLSTSDQKPFAVLMNLKDEPPANYTMEAYLGMLKEYGPIWITTGDGFSSHARILIGIYGGGDYHDSFFEFADPRKGKIYQVPALNFFSDFEKEARFLVDNNRDNIALRIQIYHYDSLK